MRRWCTPPDLQTYTLRIPEGSRDVFLDRLSTVPEEDRFTIDRYTVRKGDTFTVIAKKTGVPVPVILSLNSYTKVMPLKNGQEIYLPPKALFALDREDRSLLKKASYKKSSYQKAVKKASTHRAGVKRVSSAGKRNKKI